MTRLKEALNLPEMFLDGKYILKTFAKYFGDSLDTKAHNFLNDVIHNSESQREKFEGDKYEEKI